MPNSMEPDPEINSDPTQSCTWPELQPVRMALEGSLRHRHQPQHPVAPPPSYEECVSEEQLPSAGLSGGTQLPIVPPLSQDEARQALLKKINKQWCVNKAPAIEFTFVRISPSSAYRYELETFTEARTIAWAYTPYAGGPVSGPEGSSCLEPEPDPWSVQAESRPLFQDGEQQIELPHTATVEVCSKCQGAGRTQCWKCKGGGKVSCTLCSGNGKVPKAPPPGPKKAGSTQQQVTGMVERITCNCCSGAGNTSCPTCGTTGVVGCETCDSKGRVKRFKQLTVTWKTTSMDRIMELTGLDHKCIREAKGRKLLEDERHKVAPLTDFPVPAMNKASRELIAIQATKFAAFSGEMLMQRQRVSFMPVYEVTGQWKGKEFSYWVYGYDHLAHCTDYPGGTCDCTVL